MIVFTSFHDARFRDGPKFSAARWAPVFAREWPALPALRPVDAQGRPIKLRQFPDDPLEGYHRAYRDALRSRTDKVANDCVRVVHAQNSGIVYICCWCPHSSVSRRQMAEHETFACHLLLLARLFRRQPWSFGVAHEKYGAAEWRLAP